MCVRYNLQVGANGKPTAHSIDSSIEELIG